jgi:hypothetical protein
MKNGGNKTSVVLDYFANLIGEVSKIVQNNRHCVGDPLIENGVHRIFTYKHKRENATRLESKRCKNRLTKNWKIRFR